MFRPLLLLSVLGLVACAPAPQVTAAPQPAITGYPKLLAVAQRGSLSSIDGQAQASAVGAFLDDLRSHASDSAYLSSAVNEMEQNQFGFVTAVIATAEGDPALKSQFVSNFDERVQSVGEQYRSAATIKNDNRYASVRSQLTQSQDGAATTLNAFLSLYSIPATQVFAVSSSAASSTAIPTTRPSTGMQVSGAASHFGAAAGSLAVVAASALGMLLLA